MTTTTEPKKRRPRRTHDDIRAQVTEQVLADAERAMALEREALRLRYEQAYNLLSKHDTALQLENHELRRRLASMSVRKILWSRIKEIGRAHV